MFQGLSLKAVLLGLVIDWALSLLAGIVVGVGLAIYLFSEHHHPDTAEIDAVTGSPFMVVLTFGFGAFMTLLAGLATGWIARSNRTGNGFAMSLLAVLTSLPFFPFMHGHTPLYFVVLIAITIVFGTLGGFLASFAFENKPAA